MKKISALSLLIAGLTTLLATPPAFAQEPPPPPERYFVPFSAPQNFIDHARYFEEETIQVGPYTIWSFNTPNRGFGNVIVIEGETELVILDTTVAVEHAEVAASRRA